MSIADKQVGPILISSFLSSDGDTIYESTKGMTLLEMYAGLAMQGLMASDQTGTWEQFAEKSVLASKALIAELEKEYKK